MLCLLIFCNLTEYKLNFFSFFFQGLAAVFNIALGIVSWWTSKESERYNRLIQLRVFVFCLNILHAYITGPIIYQSEDTPLLAPGKFSISPLDNAPNYLVGCFI